MRHTVQAQLRRALKHGHVLARRVSELRRVQAHPGDEVQVGQRLRAGRNGGMALGMLGGRREQSLPSPDQQGS